MLPDVAELCAALPTSAAGWLRDALDRVAAGDHRAFVAAWSAGGRKLGHAAVGHPALWAADEAGRGLLLRCYLPSLATDAHAPLVLGLYEKGELREQLAVLRALPFLPGPERFVDVATSAMRSNAVAVLEAIACDNTYPAAHLPDAMFNQLVLKAIFTGLSPRRIVDIERRRNPELARMVAAWVSERRLAGRPVPADVGVALEGEVDAAL